MIPRPFRGRRSCAPPGGFTLMELLICMVIVTVLAALLVPALRVARLAAERAACAGNLHQVGIALDAYRADHNDVLPGPGGIVRPPGGVSAGMGDWPARMALPAVLVPDYLPSAAVFHCPSDPSREIPSYYYEFPGVSIPLPLASVRDPSVLPVVFGVIRLDGPSSDLRERVTGPHDGAHMVLHIDGHVEMVNTEQLLFGLAEWALNAPCGPQFASFRDWYDRLYEYAHGYPPSSECAGALRCPVSDGTIPPSLQGNRLP